MSTVADWGGEFARRAKNGELPSVIVAEKHIEALLGVLANEGLRFARHCLGKIGDPEIRRIVEALFYPSVAGAAIGVVIGAAVAGPAGAQVGALVGAGAGFVVGCVAITLTRRKQDGPNGPEFVLAVAQ